MKIMFLGTSSGAGKTTVTALYCRHLKNKNVNVCPFKASNLSLNSYVTKEGEEIGMGQAFQAWACGMEPTGAMNPILLKPSGNGSIQLILNGVPETEITKEHPADRKRMFNVACDSFDSLEREHNAIVCEGSGSPAELNLIEQDIANLGMVKARSIPSILVADIERGGVFAAIYGTWLIIPDDLKPLMKGFIINRFRGDASILKSGIDKVEELTGMKCIGVLQYLDLKFPEEDSMSDKNGELHGENIREAFMNNLDILLDNAIKSGLDLDLIDKIANSSA